MTGKIRLQSKSKNTPVQGVFLDWSIFTSELCLIQGLLWTCVTARQTKISRHRHQLDKIMWTSEDKWSQRGRICLIWLIIAPTRDTYISSSFICCFSSSLFGFWAITTLLLLYIRTSQWFSKWIFSKLHCNSEIIFHWSLYDHFTEHDDFLFFGLFCLIYFDHVKNTKKAHWEK